MSHTIRLLTVATTLIVALTAAPAHGLDLAPQPPEPKPSLWAEIEPVCFGLNGDSPGIRWHGGNTTNGTHLFSIYRNGTLLYDSALAPGEVKTGAIHSHLWEDTTQSYEVRWKHQDKTLAMRSLWLNCIEPELAASFEPTDAQGAPCAGPLTVTVANSGTQQGQVRIRLGNDVVKQVLLQKDTSMWVDLEPDPGDWVSGTVLDHGAHEFFFGIEVVDCTAEEPPADEPDGEEGGEEGGQDEPKVDDSPGEPGGTWQEADDPEPGVVEGLPEPVIADHDGGVADSDRRTAGGDGLDREIGLLRARHLAGPVPSSSLGSPWGWTALVVAAAVCACALLAGTRATARR